jgi:hypothetical protein
VDDDCNGTADDGYVSSSCSTGLPGICSAGTLICSNGSEVCSQNSQAQTEGPFGDATCSDQVDNDCDGTMDSADAGCTQECIPSLLSPADGALFVSPTPVLDWTDASGAASYDVQICSDSSCADIVQSATVTESQWSISQSSPLMLGEQYWWRVLADNPGCGTNGWTETWDFTTSLATRIMDFNNGSQTGEMSIKTLDSVTELSVLDSVGMPDILWQHKIRSDVYLWFMEGIYIGGGADLGSVTDPDWKIVSADDINKDGAPDILLQHMTKGDLSVWYMSGTNIIGEEYIASVADPDWKIAGTDDFNGDGYLDFLWQHQVRADAYLWFMKGRDWLGGHYMGTSTDKNWNIVSTADFNGDFRPDILWHHALRGDVYVWLMDGVDFLDGMHLGTVSDTNWMISGTDDYNGDLSPDILWQNIMTGEISIWLMDNTVLLGITDIASVYDPDWMIVAPK